MALSLRKISIAEFSSFRTYMMTYHSTITRIHITSAKDWPYTLSSILICIALIIIIGSVAQIVFYNLYRHPYTWTSGRCSYIALSDFFSLVGGSRYSLQTGKLSERYGKSESQITDRDKMCDIYISKFDRKSRSNYA